jgi:hypothetical protein
VDFDRDGWLDLAVANGHVTDHRKRGVPFRMKPQLFRGSAAGFGPLPFHGDADYWNRPALGRAMATWDWNRDLRPDLVIGHLFEPTVLLENRTQAGHAVTFELVGTRSERDAVGAEVRLEIGEHRWTGWQTGGDGFLCSNQATIDFGLGSATRIDRVTVLWPSGGTQTIRDLAVDTAYLVVEGCDAVDAR